jgi:hypothetical protein
MPLPGSNIENPLRVFLCHGSDDKPAVRQLYHRLQGDGYAPWLDEENLLPGQDWREEIKLAIRSVDAIVVCLSRMSIDRNGFIQDEISFALNAADERREDAPLIIPARLEACDIPDRLLRWHWVDLFDPTGYERLLRGLNARSR